MKQTAHKKNRKLLGKNDPLPFEVEPRTGPLSCLVVADHAGEAVPESLGNLGIARDAVEDHRWYDVGSRALARHLALMLDTTAVYATYSRLVIDLNRSLDFVDVEIEDTGLTKIPGNVPEELDGIVIPANRNLPAAEKQKRIDEIFNVYHRQVAQELEAIRIQKALPALISVHSFTPVFHGYRRPWDIGILWYRDQRLALPVMDNLRAQNPDLVIGDNEPYSLQMPTASAWNYTTRVHAEEKGLANLLVEVRNDLLENDEAAERMAAVVFRALKPVLAGAETV